MFISISKQVVSSLKWRLILRLHNEIKFFSQCCNVLILKFTFYFISFYLGYDLFHFLYLMSSFLSQEDWGTNVWFSFLVACCLKIFFFLLLLLRKTTTTLIRHRVNYLSTTKSKLSSKSRKIKIYLLKILKSIHVL